MKSGSDHSAPRNLVLAALLLALPHCTTTPQHAGVSSVSNEPRAAFELHSGMWINLHQELLHHARSTWKWRHRVLPERPIDPAWKNTIDLYRTRYAELENLDVRLSSIAVDLATANGEGDVSSDNELRAALSSAAETYRRKQWPEDDRRNREWIERVTPLLDRYGDTMREEIASASDISWPKGTLRIEVVTFVDPFGAQTTDVPSPLTMISSADPGYAGDASLEMIFHEASHLFDDQLRKGIIEESRQLGVPEPEGLWHAILFYTAGYFAKKHLGESYVPYAEAQGLFKRGDWTRYQPIIASEWEPRLRGGTSLREALRNVLRKLNPRTTRSEAKVR